MTIKALTRPPRAGRTTTRLSQQQTRNALRTPSTGWRACLRAGVCPSKGGPSSCGEHRSEHGRRWTANEEAMPSQDEGPSTKPGALARQVVCP
jgi:hypothetical protein